MLVVFSWDFCEFLDDICLDVAAAGTFASLDGEVGIAAVERVENFALFKVAVSGVEIFRVDFIGVVDGEIEGIGDAVGDGFAVVIHGEGVADFKVFKFSEDVRGVVSVHEDAGRTAVVTVVGVTRAGRRHRAVAVDFRD